MNKVFSQHILLLGTLMLALLVNVASHVNGVIGGGLKKESGLYKASSTISGLPRKAYFYVKKQFVSPLERAIDDDNRTEVQELLKLGEDPNALDHTGRPLIEKARSEGRRDIVNLLKYYGANPE